MCSCRHSPLMISHASLTLFYLCCRMYLCEAFVRPRQVNPPTRRFSLSAYFDMADVDEGVVDTFPASAAAGSKPALHRAVESGSLDQVREQLAKDSGSLNRDHGLDGTPLAAALRGHHLQIAELLIKGGANVNQALTDGGGKCYTAAHIAARLGDVDGLTLLKKHGADFNRKGEDGWTPLHAATFAGKRQAMTYLMDNGSDVNARNVHNITPLFFSTGHGRVGDTRELLSRGARTDLVDANGDGIMHHVFHYQLSKMFEGEYEVPECQLDVGVILALSGADVNATNFDGAKATKFFSENNVPSLDRVLQILSHNKQAFAESKTEWNYMTLLRARIEHFMGIKLEMKHAVDLFEGMQALEKERQAEKQRQIAERPAGGCPVMKLKKKAPASADGAAAPPATHHGSDVDLAKLKPGEDPSGGQCPFFKPKPSESATPNAQAPAAVLPHPKNSVPSSVSKPAASVARSDEEGSGAVKAAASATVDPLAAFASWRAFFLFLMEHRSTVMFVMLAFLLGMLFEQRFGRRL